MESQGKAKVALTFALYQGEQLVRRETVSQDIVKVGKDARSHLRVDDDLASRMHAVIEVAGPQDITLIDLGNEPGTLVNTQRVNKCKIRPGDQIQIGSTVIVLESAEISTATSVIPRPSAAPAASASAPPPAFAQHTMQGFSPAPTAGGFDNMAAAQHMPPAAPTGFGSTLGGFGGGNPFAAQANPFASAASAAPNPFASSPPGGATANPFAAGNNPFAAQQAVQAPDFGGQAVPGSDPYAYGHDAGAGTGYGNGNGHAPAAWNDVAAAGGPVGYSLVRSGPDVNPDEVEIAHLASIEVMILWDDNVLHVSHLTPPRNFYVGEELSVKKQPCDFFMPAEALGASRAPIVVASGGSASLLILPGSVGEVDIPRQGKVDLATLVAQQKARPSHEMAGAFEFELPAGARARMTLPNSGITFQVSAVNAGRPVPVGFFATLDGTAFIYTGLSFLLHMGLVAILYFFMPPLGSTSGEEIADDQLLLMQKILDAAADRELEEQKTNDTSDKADEKEGGTGARAKGEEGKMGNQNSQEVGHKYGVQGPKDNPDPHLARQAALAEARETAIGLIAMAGGGDPNSPTAPWGREESSGVDDKSARGNMFGDTIGDSQGNGGLGLTGMGEGGGGNGTGLGLGEFGFGHGAGTGDGQGIGNGHGRLGKGHSVHSPGIRQGNPSVNGRLPKEVIQRIVRQNSGRYRMCYEAGLRSNPNLTGRVQIKFVIDRSGAVILSSDGGSDLPDHGVINCVVSSFRALSFPAPEGGNVTVDYPLNLTPPD